MKIFSVVTMFGGMVLIQGGDTYDLLIIGYLLLVISFLSNYLDNN